MALKQNGKKEKFSTNAQRDSQENKSRPDLISPFAMIRKGIVMRDGAKYYGERNYEAGIPISRCIASCYRHLMQYIMGDKTEDHIAQLGVNADFIMHFEEMIKLGVLPKELDDLPHYIKKSKENTSKGSKKKTKS